MLPDYSARRQAVRERLRELQADAFLISSPFNVTYLTGFTGEDSSLLLLEETELLVSDARYQQQLAEECPEIELHIRPPSTNLLTACCEVIKRRRVVRLAVEADHISHANYKLLEDLLGGDCLAAASGWVEQLRMIKDRWELERIERAVVMAERAFESLRGWLTPETTEKQVADFLESAIRHLGGKQSAFPVIVGVGPRAALPHGRPGPQRVGEHPLLLIDWGANEGQYLSDLTRVLVTSRIGRKLVRIYQAVLDAHLAAEKLLRPGVTAEAVDQAARAELEKAGLGSYFNHGLGHGFGLQIHEAPRLAARQPLPLEAGMVITIEPGVYQRGWGGVRLEDDYLIVRDGCRRLSSLPRELDANCLELL